jgi:hypothetical protein
MPGRNYGAERRGRSTGLDGTRSAASAAGGALREHYQRRLRADLRGPGRLLVTRHRDYGPRRTHARSPRSLLRGDEARKAARAGSNLGGGPYPREPVPSPGLRARAHGAAARAAARLLRAWARRGPSGATRAERRGQMRAGRRVRARAGRWRARLLPASGPPCPQARAHGCLRARTPRITSPRSPPARLIRGRPSRGRSGDARAAWARVSMYVFSPPAQHRGTAALASPPAACPHAAHRCQPRPSPSPLRRIRGRGIIRPGPPADSDPAGGRARHRTYDRGMS